MTNHPTSSSEHEEAARACAAPPPHRAPARATYLQREAATQAASRDTAPLSIGQFRTENAALQIRIVRNTFRPEAMPA